MLKNAFHVRYKGVIWKIRPDESAEHLVTEVRSPENKIAFFSCIRTDSGKATFDHFQLQEPWFCGLEAAAHGTAFLHGYLSETLPEHRGIFAVDLAGGKLLWEDYNLVFDQAVQEGVVAWNYKAEPRRYQLIDPRSGRSIRYFRSRTEAMGDTNLPGTPEMHYPSRVTLDTPLRELLPENVLSEADLLEWKGYRILSCYVLRNDKEEEKNRPLDHYLLVFDGGGNRIHQDLLAGGILQPAMDTFFVMNDRLYYIKSKAEILAYLL